MEVASRSLHRYLSEFRSSAAVELVKVHRFGVILHRFQVLQNVRIERRLEVYVEHIFRFFEVESDATVFGCRRN